MNYWEDKKVLVTGGHGFVGHSVIEELEHRGPKEIIAHPSEQYDLTNEKDVHWMFKMDKPDVVIHLAGMVGGIGANKAFPADFFLNNALMGIHVTHYAFLYADRLVSLAAGCGYPKHLVAPFKEEDFWSGMPDENSIGYSMAKKNLIIQSWAYRDQYGFNSSVLLPANLYGPHDNFDLEGSHVVPALIRKFIEARDKKKKSVEVWGTGIASREFLYVKDTARAILDVAEKYNESGPLNLGTGVETTIKELVETISDLVGFKGRVIWDKSRPDGQPRRFYDMTKFKEAIGYVPSTSLVDGIKETIEWYENKRES